MEKSSVMLTPVKAVKGQTEVEKQWDKAADDLFSRAVSKVRQPIEGLFNWLIEKNRFSKSKQSKIDKGTDGACVWQNCRCLYKLNFLTLDSH